MPNAAANNFAIAFLVAGVLFLVVMLIFFRRYRQIRLQITLLRGFVPMFFALVCICSALTILDVRPDFALQWSRFIVVLILSTEGFNLTFLNFVIYGRHHATTGTINATFLGLNLFMLLAEENFTVQLSPDFMAFYPVLGLIFFGTNILYGLIHSGYDAWANLKILRRSDISFPMKLKFLLFTCGISTMFLTFAVTTLADIVFNTGLYFFWSVVGCYVSLVLTFLGLFYANPSVFCLPTRIYVLVVFKVGDPAGMIYEKRFTPIQSQSLNLLGPGVASIADLVQNSFQKSKHLSLFSLSGRKLLYEWGEGFGAVLIADEESTVFRNCLRLVLKTVSLLSVEPEKFDAQVIEIFSFYTNERRE